MYELSILGVLSAPVASYVVGSVLDTVIVKKDKPYFPMADNTIANNTNAMCVEARRGEHSRGPPKVRSTSERNKDER
jgi:hypothetical protein